MSAGASSTRSASQLPSFTSSGVSSMVSEMIATAITKIRSSITPKALARTEQHKAELAPLREHESDPHAVLRPVPKHRHNTIEHNPP
jgi:hypothetical protein